MDVLRFTNKDLIIFYKKDFTNYYFVFANYLSGICSEYELECFDPQKSIIAEHGNLVEKLAEALDRKLIKTNSDYLSVWCDLWRYEAKHTDIDDFFVDIMDKVKQYNKESGRENIENSPNANMG